MIKITTTILNFPKYMFVCLIVFIYKQQLKTIEANSPCLMNNIVMYIVLCNIMFVCV